MKELKPPVPLWRWVYWGGLLAPALFLFYVLFTPVWLGIRVARLLAEARSRKKPDPTSSA